MASTNKTTHYELSQYVGSDKPTYLTDYNNDMSAIDTGIYNAQTKADSAFANAGIADGKAVQAQSDATTALNSAGSANTNIGTMANLTTTEKSTLVGALNEVNYNVGQFNLSVFESPSTTTASAGSIVSNTVSIAKNTSGSLAKIYGTIQVGSFTGTGTLKVVMSTSLRPESEITINNAGMIRLLDSTTIQSIKDFSITIKTNGDIEMESSILNNTATIRFMLWPCLYFIKDFGDTPEPQI